MAKGSFLSHRMLLTIGLAVLASSVVLYIYVNAPAGTFVDKIFNRGS